MANESNYYMVLLHNPNQVDEKQACPTCHNDNMDALIIKDDDTVICCDCGTIYHV